MAVCKANDIRNEYRMYFAKTLPVDCTACGLATRTGADFAYVKGIGKADFTHAIGYRSASG